MELAAYCNYLSKISIIMFDELVVSELINSELHAWRSELIMSTFHREDAKAICKISLSRRNVLYIPGNRNQPSIHYGSVLQCKISR